MSRRRWRVLPNLLLILLFATLHAHAAEEGGAANQAATDLFKWINFAIVAGTIIWLCVKKAPGFFGRRAEAIRSAITNATASKAEADRRVKEAENKLAGLEQEIVQLRAVAQREGVAEAERIRNVTQSDAQKIALAAKAEIEAAERAARLELKAIAAKLAVDGAESLLTKQLTPQVQESLVAAFVQGLEGRPN